MSSDRQPFPRLDSPFIDVETGYLTDPWYRFLISLWQKLGGASSGLLTSAWLRQSGSTVSAVNARTGVVIGPGALSFGQINPLAQTNVAFGASPATLTASANGSMVISGGAQVELSRPPGAFIIASLVGGPIPVLTGDLVRLTWFGTIKPTATLFPFGTS